MKIVGGRLRFLVKERGGEQKKEGYTNTENDVNRGRMFPEDERC